MRGTRIGLFALTAALAIAGGLAPVTATTGFTESEHLIEGAPGPSPEAPDSRHCTGPTGGCMIAATLFLPDPLPALPVPAVLSQHGFPGTRQESYVRKAAELLASQGYVVLTWDARGFGQSQGYVMLDSPDHEAVDVQRLIDFLAARPEVKLDAAGDPRVGMYGQSYGGGIQFVSAAHDSRIDVLVVREAWNDLVSALFPNGIIKQQWVTLLFGAGQGTTQGHLAPDLNEWFAEAFATNDLPDNVRDELRRRSASFYASQIDIPTFILQGERDTLFNLLEGSRNVELVAANGAPTKLFWYWGGHGGYSNYPDGTNWQWVPGDVMESRQLAWLNRYLKGDTTVDTGPMFEYFDQNGILQSLGHAPKLVGQTLSLGSAGQTFVKPSGRNCPTFGAPNCSYTEVSNFSSPGQPGDRPPFDPPGTFVALDTAPLLEEIKIVGNPRATFTVTTVTGQPVSLFFKFFDVAPGGTATLINRMVTPVSAVSGRQYSLDLTGFPYTFATGHRLRLVIASTDAAYFPTDAADQITLTGPVSLQLAR